MSALRELLELHQYGQAYQFVGLFLLVWFVLLAAFVAVAWLKGRDRPVTDDEWTAHTEAMATWHKAHIARQHADLRRDSRAKHVADKALRDAMSARLKAGV